MIPDNVLVRADMSAALWAKRNGTSNYAVDLFLDIGNVYGAGANSTINFFIHSLRRLDKLPSTLFIQVDGAKSNKNKVFFHFLSHLVEIKLFNKISVMFLPVGHSHAYCDRFFGVIRKKIHETDQFTPSELTSSVVEVNGVRSVRHERMNFNIKSWIEPQSGRALDGIFKNMFFEFEKVDDKNAIRYRPLGSKLEGQKTKYLPSITGVPRWLIRSTDDNPIQELLNCAEGEFPLPIINNWKKVNERIRKAPNAENWNSVINSLLSRRSTRVEDQLALQQRDKVELDSFVSETKKTKKRKLNEDYE